MLDIHTAPCGPVVAALQTEQGTGGPGGHQLLAGGDNEHTDDRALGRDVGVRTDGDARLGVELDAEESESGADPLAYERRVLADSGRERERVETARRGGHRCDGAGDPVDEHVKRKRGVRSACAGGTLELDQAVRTTECRQSRVEVEGVVELVDLQSSIVQQIYERTRIDRTRSRDQRQ